MQFQFILNIFIIKIQQLKMQMEAILNQLEKNKSWKDVLRGSCKKNGINTSLAGQLTILKTRALYHRFSKSPDQSDQRSKYFWGQNELKAFHWSLICLSAINQKKIVQFAKEEWRSLSQIFRSKQLFVLEYQAAKLLHLKDKKSQAWDQQEQLLLTQIINFREFSDQNKWNQVARKLYQNSEKKYFRTGKQCREKWFNHLDPSKKHGSWTKQDDLKLILLVQTQGRKWAKIVKSFNNQRTEHMIKNRFKSILMKQKKLTPQIKKEEKIIKALIQRLKNSQQEINAEVQSQYEQEENQDKFMQQAEDKTVKSPSNFSSNNISSKHSSRQRQLKQNEKSASQSKKNQLTENTLHNYFEQASDANKNQAYNGFKMYSPYCLAYMGSNLTPTGLTPTYFSPPAFFMNSFSQSVMSFQHYLNNNMNQNNGQGNVGNGSNTNIKTQ